MHPVFLTFSGPGTGKSRLLDEFQNLCLRALQKEKYEELYERLEKAYVFKVTFENGTSYSKLREPSFEIGTRMLYQLSSSYDDYQFQLWGRDSKNCVTPIEAIKALAAAENKKLEEMTVIILVDGIQVLPHTLGGRDSVMKLAMNSVVDLVNAAPFFCIAAFAGTFYDDASEILSSTAQQRVRLTPPSLDGTQVIKSDEPLIRMIIDDMGGHARALEALAEELDTLNYNLDNISLRDFMVKLRSKLEAKYPFLPTLGQELKIGLIAVLMRYELSEFDVIPNTKLKVSTLCSYGLFRYDAKKKIITCPFIFIWLFATWSAFPALVNFNLDGYRERQHEDDPCIPPGLQCWQHWEYLPAQFRMLKSHLLAGQIVKFSDLHKGADLGKSADQTFVQVTQINNICRSDRKYEYEQRQNNSTIVTETNDEVDYTHCNSIIMNKYGASAGDIFCGVKEIQSGRNVVVQEIYQMKHIEKDTDYENFKQELEKSRKQLDWFIYFTTGSLKKDFPMDKLPARAGIVHQENMKDYFGPFASRAFLKKEININTATRYQLLSIQGIGEVKANKILEQRKISPFQNEQDFRKRTSITIQFPPTVLFPNSSNKGVGSQKFSTLNNNNNLRFIQYPRFRTLSCFCSRITRIFRM